MRKLFSIFAALLVALTASAATWSIDASDEGNLRRTLRDKVQAGDTVLLADGTYDEGQSLNVNSKVVVMPEKNAKPVIEMKGYFNLYATAKFEGLKFKYISGDGYCMYFRQGVSEDYLWLEGCEFDGFTSYCVSSWSENYHIDSCIVNNCYFHDLGKGPFYFIPSKLDGNIDACGKLKVTNCTFANIKVVDWVSVLDLRNNANNVTGATSILEVDHCTFYNCKGDYDRLIQNYKSPLSTITNCIMMNPLEGGEEPNIYATYLYGGSVHHNLNYQTKRQYGSGVTVTDSIQRDPQFVDALNGNYTLASTSPAIGAGSDGSNLGDPRWWPTAPAIEPVENLEINFMTDPYTVTGGALPAGVEIAGSWHDNQHGYNYPKVSIPVAAGNYKITIGNCVHSNNNGASVKNADESATLNLIDKNGQTITSFLAKDNCYDAKPTENFTSAWLVVDADQTIKIICPQYTPYLKFEKVDAVPEAKTMYTVTFVNEDADAEGIVPPAIEVEAGMSITIPLNYTLYKEGYTLTAWMSGSGNPYAPGTLFEPKDNTTLTAAFSKNTVDNILELTTDLTVKWVFGESNGVPSVAWNGAEGFLVTQAAKIDVKLDIDAKSGKFSNSGRGDEWAQVNNGTIFSFPSKEGAIVKTRCYAEPAGSLVDNAAYTSWEENVATFNVDPTAGVSQLANNADNVYYSYLEISLPATVAKYDITPNGSIENGSIAVDKSQAAEGETITITINPASEYELDWLKVNGSETGITIAADKLSATFTMPAEAVTVDAAFKKVIVYYNVTIAPTTNGIVEADKATAAEGEEVKLTITPDENYALDELEVIGNVTSNAVTVTDGAFKMPAEAVTVSATFKYNKFAVEIASGIQHGSVSANKAEAVAGEEVKLTYTPEEYWELDEVEVIGKETSKAVTVTDGAFKMPAEAVTVNATFKAIPQNWTVTQAYDFIEGLAVGGKKEGKFTVTGFVTKVDYKYSESSKNMTIWIADANSEKEVQLFKATPEDEASQKINIGDKVTSTADSLIKFKKNEETPIARELARPSVKLIEAAASRSCADVYKMADGMEVNLNDVVVTFVNGKNVWVRDASASLLIYMPANATYKAGDVLSGVVAELDIYNKVYELKPTAAQVSAITVTAGSAPAPIEIASIAIEDMNKYVIVKGLEVVGEFKNNAQTNIDVKIGGETIVLRNQFRIAYTFEAGKKYDITAVVTIYSNKPQLYFVSAAESSATGIENVGMTEKAVKVMENGQIYIIKNGVRYSITGSEIR